jgi:hypothetical protein
LPDEFPDNGSNHLWLVLKGEMGMAFEPLNPNVGDHACDPVCDLS